MISWIGLIGVGFIVTGISAFLFGWALVSLFNFTVYGLGFIILGFVLIGLSPFFKQSSSSNKGEDIQK